ncbi:MAG TPA: amino acid permease [Geopsychrobacteraceae bacterium]|nr:amino acid permease [Geopsychrobacteraceae bacterium]
MSDEEHDKISRGEDEEGLQEQVEDKKEKQEAPQQQLFGTFGGVFTPTLLTILGVIMFLREGWVVGNAGLLGAWAIILLSFAITGFTGFSLASITTNIRIGAGGAFNIISQSLGLEVGGSIGIPLYLAQALAVSMYIFGFRAGWQWIFPDHPALLVDLATFGILFAIAFVSAGLAFRIQYLILAVIILSLVSIAVAAYQGSMQYPVQWFGDFPGSAANDFSGIGFWAVFAVFFPASTGIMAGANMSGELKNPRKSIPVGTLSAIGLSLVIYMVLAYWLARSATVDELTGSYTVMIDKAAWGPAVLAGLLGATFSSALSSLVGAPRILQALGQHKVVPASDWLTQKTDKGEPRNALFLTGAIVMGALMLRDLNAVAPLITLFFLITYAMINVVVSLEQSMKLVSFRPLFRVPRLVSALGAFGCAFAMIVVNPTFSIIAIAVVLVIHAILIRRHLEAPFGDVRSGLFVALAEWAAKKAGELSASRERTWKANLLVPVEEIKQVRRVFGLIRDISQPKGFLKVVGLTGRVIEEKLTEELPALIEELKDEKIFASWTVISAASFGDNLQAGIETFGGTFFRPNLLFVALPESTDREEELTEIIETARQNQIGILLFADPDRRGLDPCHHINVWFTDHGPDWKVSMDLKNQDLAILIGYKLMQNRKAELCFVATLKDDSHAAAAERFLDNISALARIPEADSAVQTGGPEKTLKVDAGDFNIIPMAEHPDFAELRKICEQMGTACLFTLDSGEEGALA